MSIATLKRKSATKYNNMSVNRSSGFSLNGGARNQGYVGQSVFRSGCTLMCQNDSTVMKKSVLSTKGMLATRFKYIKRPQPYSSTKPDSTLNKNNQGEYIAKKVQETMSGHKLLSDGGSCATLPTDALNEKCCKTNKTTIDQDTIEPLSQSRYIRELTRKCNLYDVSNVTKTTQHTPLP